MAKTDTEPRAERAPGDHLHLGWALVLISVTGVVIFAVLTALTRWALGGWHESEHVR